MTTRDKIIEELQPMFADAKTHDLWFHSKTGNRWFSPDDLQELQGQGYYLWGKANWELRDPYEHLDQLKRQKKDIEQKIKNVEEKLST